VTRRNATSIIPPAANLVGRHLPAQPTSVNLRTDADSLRYFGSPTGTTLGIVTAALFLPAIVFSFIGDYLCQRFGRKPTIYLGSVLIIAGGIWNGMAQDLGQFAGGGFTGI